MSDTSTLIYDAFCHKAWSLFEFIADKKLYNNNPYDAMVQWIAAYHRDWLEDHPYMFVSSRFWQLYQRMLDEPLTLMRNRMLPRIQGAPPPREDRDLYADHLDWQRIQENYSKWVIGPLTERMIKPDPTYNNLVRNPLVTRLSQYGANLGGHTIADFGCGIGNLLPLLQGRVTEVYGLDFNDEALRIASEKAAELGIKFNPIKADIRDYVSDRHFDIIISVNSVLPHKREDVIRILRTMRQNLAHHGHIFFILPSFDTCEALAQYWEETYRQRARRPHKWRVHTARDTTELYIAKCVEAFKKSKKMDTASQSFADDGVHTQCFHTPASIKRDFDEAGLTVLRTVKVEYPWEYAREFDYGYFPLKDPIWDWFVEACI